MATDPGAASAQTASSDEQQTWPPPEEVLEKWMMNTVKEGDQSARFLRTLLQMNPAYGTYLQTDPDLFAVIQMFSKRLRTKVTRYESPSQMPQDIFYQTLCEMLWRVVGWIMHEVVELEEEANMPVPKEASGMIKMLLNTNTNLSNKLNDLRRAYLKELAAHRDRQRIISAQTQRAIDSLHESPIMFFDPLEFVLDDSTKAFVREAIEERMKLEMRNNFQSNEDNSEITKYIEELEGRLELANSELKTCRATNNRLEEQLKALKEREEKKTEELKAKRQELAEAQKALADSEEAMKEMQNEMNKIKRRLAHLENKNEEAKDTGPAKEEAVQYIDLNKDELEALRKKVKELEKEIEKKDKELAAKGAPKEKVEKKGEESPTSVVKQVEYVYQEDTESKKLLQQAMQVERELRAANEALEKALKETEAEMRELEKELAKLGKQVKERPKKETPKVTGPSAADIAAEKDAEFEKQMNKEKAKHEKIVANLQDEIEKLKQQLKAAKEELKELRAAQNEPSEVTPKTKVIKQVGVPEEEVSKLRVQIHEQGVEIERLEEELAKMEQKCDMLLAKLKDKFSDAEIEAIVETIRLAPPPKPKKPRKKKAFERLYDDAQRRIGEMKMRQAKLRELEDKQMYKLSRTVGSSTEARKLDMLRSLQRANTATSQRFHDALYEFDRQSRRKKRHHEGGGGDSGEESSEEEMDKLRRGRNLSDLEEITLLTYKIGVCPRCAFSAMAAFQRRELEMLKASHAHQDHKNATMKESGEDGTPWGSVLYLTEGQVPGRTLTSIGRSYTDLLSQDYLSQVVSDDDLGVPGPRSRSPGTPLDGSRTLSAASQRSGSPGLRLTGSHMDGGLGASNRGLSPLTRGPNPAQTLIHPGTPLGGGPRAGPLPYDAAYPLPTPPWRQGAQELGATQIPAMSSSAPMLRFQADSAVRGAHTKPRDIQSAASTLPAGWQTKSMPTHDALLRDAPPWRRQRSNSPSKEDRHRSQSPREPLSINARSTNDSLPQPPNGAPPRGGGGGGGMESPYGRLGRHPGSEWSMPLAPGRLPAAQTVQLDPIVKGVGHVPDSSPRTFDRSVSPEWTAKRPEFRSTTEGFSRSNRPDTRPEGLEIDYSRAATAPVPRKAQTLRRLDSDTDSPAGFRSETGGEIHTFGGGARATVWKHEASTQLPSVPPSRSATTPNLPINGSTMRLPAPWEGSSPSKKFGSKVPKKSGPGFMVTPLQSQERLSASMPARTGEG